MKHQVRLDFDVSWVLAGQKLLNDPFGRGLKQLGQQLPYRLYLQPGNEFLCERAFEIYNHFHIHETHFFELDPGQWSISIEDVTGWLDLEISQVKLNQVHLPSAAFALA